MKHLMLSKFYTIQRHVIKAIYKHYILIPCNVNFILIYVLKYTFSHLAFCIFVMFSTFGEEMQYIFIEKNFILKIFVAVKIAGTDII